MSDQQSSSPTRAPVYFLSIGGPNFMENTSHPAYTKLTAIGHEITRKVKPKAVVVFSAHWQQDPQKISVNVAEHSDIIYDFYGFPPHYYEYKYPNHGSPALAEQIIGKLELASIEVERAHRGLDHGVRVGFMAAFNPQTNPLIVPIVQVSLFANEDLDAHYRLGRALQCLRDENIVIVGAGMAAHNLHDFRTMRSTGVVRTLPYTASFDDALIEAVGVIGSEQRRIAMQALMRRGDARLAHSTLDHILPMFVAAGAGGTDIGERLWTFPEGSLNWAQYRFGTVG